MVEIGGRPILWHIMRHYSHFGHQEFFVALGYKGESIKKYMMDCFALGSNLTIQLKQDRVVKHANNVPDWTVHLIDTGAETMTGGRIKRLAPYIGNQTFMLTWGDGLSDVNLNDLLGFHRSHGRLATVTAVRPPARFGHLQFDGDRLVDFTEKPQTQEGWINGAFFVLEPAVFDYIASDQTQWEREPLETLARQGQLMAYRHQGFLAVHGHTTRQEAPAGALGQGRRALENLGVTLNESGRHRPSGLHRIRAHAHAAGARAPGAGHRLRPLPVLHIRRPAHARADAV